MKTKAAAMESQGGASAITARVCLPRYKALLQRFIAATSASQQAKMAFKDVAVGRMVSQARMMKQFDHIVSPAARAVETLPSLLQHGARSHARAVLALTPPGPPPPLLLRSRHHVPAQSSDEELRDEWERDPDLITKAITRTTHGSVRSAYVQAQEKSMVRRPRFPLPAAHAALLAADRSPSHKTIQARCVATRLCASASLSQEMKELLRDIEEVSKMAAEIAELVEARSETIQSIVGNVDMANDYGEGGAPSASNWVGGRARPPAPRRLRQCRSNLLSVAPGHPPPPFAVVLAVKQGERSLEKGLNSMRAARRRMCCFAIIAVVVLLIVSGVIGGVLGGA